MDERDRERLLRGLLGRIAAGEGAGGVVRADAPRGVDAETLAAYLDGALLPEERRAVRERLAGDPGLRQALEELAREHRAGGGTRDPGVASGEDPVVREPAPPAGATGGSHPPARGSDRILGLVVCGAAAALLLAVALVGPRGSPARIDAAGGPGRVVGVRGEVVVARGRLRSHPLRLWEGLEGGEELRVGRGGSLDVLRATGLYRLTAGGWTREIGDLPDKAVAFSRGGLGPRPGAIRSAGTTPRPLAVEPLGRALERRPRFTWLDPRPPWGGERRYRVTLRGPDGGLFLARVTGSGIAISIGFVDGVADLVEGAAYSWELRDGWEDAPGAADGLVFEQTFVVATARERQDLDREEAGVTRRIEDPALRELLLAFVAWDRHFLGIAARRLRTLLDKRPGDEVVAGLLDRVLGVPVCAWLGAVNGATERPR